MGKKILLIALFIFCVDQLTKFFLKDVDSFLTTPMRNTGIAFGFFQGYNLLFVGITLGILGFIFWGIHRISQDLHTAMGLLVGGALGNLFDRIFFGYVVDFIDLKFFPVFNVADFSNTLAVFLMFIYFLKNERVAIMQGKKILLKDVALCENIFSRAKGLMFSKPLKKGEGLLIPFKSPTTRNALHMLFVFFPIDIFWLNSRGKIVDIRKNALPFTFLITPRKPASFALEVKPKSLLLGAGDIIQWKSKPKK